MSYDLLQNKKIYKFSVIFLNHQMMKVIIKYFFRIECFFKSVFCFYLSLNYFFRLLTALKRIYFLFKKKEDKPYR